jgi:hypothetical protein
MPGRTLAILIFKITVLTLATQIPYRFLLMIISSYQISLPEDLRVFFVGAGREAEEPPTKVVEFVITRLEECMKGHGLPDIPEIFRRISQEEGVSELVWQRWLDRELGKLPHITRIGLAR